MSVSTFCPSTTLEARASSRHNVQLLFSPRCFESLDSSELGRGRTWYPKQTSPCFSSDQGAMLLARLSSTCARRSDAHRQHGTCCSRHTMRWLYALCSFVATHMLSAVNCIVSSRRPAAETPTPGNGQLCPVQNPSGFRGAVTMVHETSHEQLALRMALVCCEWFVYRWVRQRKHRADAAVVWSPPRALMPCGSLWMNS